MFYQRMRGNLSQPQLCLGRPRSEGAERLPGAKPFHPSPLRAGGLGGTPPYTPPSPKPPTLPPGPALEEGEENPAASWSISAGCSLISGKSPAPSSSPLTAREEQALCPPHPGHTLCMSGESGPLGVWLQPSTLAAVSIPSGKPREIPPHIHTHTQSLKFSSLGKSLLK